MKKLTAVFALATITAALGILSSCSSAPKPVEEPPMPAAVSETTPIEQPVLTDTALPETAVQQNETLSQNDSLNLGASSAGRAH